MTLRLVKPVGSAEPSKPRADALDELYDVYAADVLRWARRLAGPGADVEDIMHDVFVVALQRGFTFQGGATVRTWLFRITHHVVGNRTRRSFLRRLIFARRRQELEAGLPAPATPHQEMERREAHERLYRALDRLPERYRTALILYEMDGLSSDEIAELTGVSVGAVWARLHRGRAKLLSFLTQESGT